MRVLALSALRDFWESSDSTAEVPMRLWFREAEAANWDNFADVRLTFGQTDIVKGRYVFDIGGNKWRIIARINFEHHRILVRWVGGHREYAKLSVDDIAQL